MPKHRASKAADIRRRVRLWLVQEDMTQADLAEQLGITESRLSLILRGHVKANLQIAADIERLIGIPASEFAEVA